jgi:hypothetical protein
LVVHGEEVLEIVGILVAHVLDDPRPDLPVLLLIAVDLVGQGIEKAISWIKTGQISPHGSTREGSGGSWKSMGSRDLPSARMVQAFKPMGLSRGNSSAALERVILVGQRGILWRSG